MKSYAPYEALFIQRSGRGVLRSTPKWSFWVMRCAFFRSMLHSLHVSRRGMLLLRLYVQSRMHTYHEGQWDYASTSSLCWSEQAFENIPSTHSGD